MKIYLVGGAVRDELLGLPVQEKDYVVIGANVDQMLQAGFQPVGKAFPVFLHPKTKEEYALARTEKKVDKGYHGFTFHADPAVTLEEDLRRRDLTINAMAKNIEEGTIYDPYHGQEDLEEKWLKHVSEAFIEDPVRILRVARFAARFTYLGFQIHPDTLTLMKAMVAQGEADALISERVWRETQTALTERHPEVFFQVLNTCGALQKLFPGLEDNVGQAMDALMKVTQLTPDPIIRFAAMGYDKGHSLRLPSDYQQLAGLVAKYRTDCQPTHAEAALTLLEQVDAFRRPDRFRAFLMACLIDENASKRIESLFQAAHSIDTANIAAKNPERIKEAIREARLEAIKNKLSTL